MTPDGKHLPDTRSPYGAVAAAHPDAVQAGIDVLAAGGTAVDAAIAAQAVVCVLLPQAAGLGGDLLALVHDDGQVTAVTGAGASPAAMRGTPPTTGGLSVTVPGLVDAWVTLHARWGRLPLADLLHRAGELARSGTAVDPGLAAALRSQHDRLMAGGARSWGLLEAASREAPWLQPELADLLEDVGRRGRAAFYEGQAARAIAAAVRAHEGVLSALDLATHSTPVGPPLDVEWSGARVFVQPPPSQGVLLALALQAVEDLENRGVAVDDHVLVEVTQAVFAHRDSCALGADLLAQPLVVDLETSSHRRGPRAYLHTAGVAVADAAGQVVSSLISVFDDFGSGVFVPELGLVLNNRAAGFTRAHNEAGPSKRPVHTLAPCLVQAADGSTLALATPGADGQVQTLLQVLSAIERPGTSLADAIARPRWRSQEGHLMVEPGHPATADLRARDHDVREGTSGADLFGAVVAAGHDSSGSWAVADWRRTTSAGVVAR
jgi:gamma-glutamyltranspeptidase/glutathione hydrolase